MTPRSDLLTVADLDGAVLLDLKGDSITTLNETGAFIWSALRRKESLQQVVEQLSALTGTDSQIVLADARIFVDSLRAGGLVQE